MGTTAIMGHPRLVLRAAPLLAKPKLQVRSRNSFVGAPRCEVRSAKGKRLPFESITVKSPVGEGSFGQVFQVRMSKSIILHAWKCLDF